VNFETQIPNKDNYKFKEVTSITGVKPYVLRFWESEFEQICPSLNEAGHKLYSAADVEFVQKVKDMLFESKLSIPEVKTKLVEDYEAQKLMEQEKATLIAQEALQTVAPSPSIDDVEQVLSSHNIITSHSSSIELMQNALKVDLLQQKEVLQAKNFNDNDVIHLVQAKKKLSIVLGKCNSIIEKNGWN
jgi:DNA-binding transcriptional MerR regulator